MSYEDKKQEFLNQAQNEKVNVLAVLASQDDDYYPFDKIVVSQAFKNSSVAKQVSIQTTTYEKFLDGSKKDTFDCVLFTFMKSASSDDIEMKQDYYDFYGQVPIVHYAIAKKEQDEEEMQGLIAFMKKTLGKRLTKEGEPLLFEDANDVAASAAALSTDLQVLIDTVHQQKSGHVFDSFLKFDKDQNCSIDVQELAELCKSLGYPIPEGKEDAHMAELDLNNDGVIDFSEFSRWYFTGMKQYGNRKRSMLQMRNRTVKIVNAIEQDKILAVIQEDKSMSTHKVSVAFNEPTGGLVVETKAHFLGPFTQQLEADGKAFSDELRDEYKEVIDKDLSVYSSLVIHMKPGQKEMYQSWCDDITKLFDKVKAKAKGEVQIFLKFYVDDDKVTAKFLGSAPEKKSDWERVKLPDAFKEALNEVEQFVRFKVHIGADAEEILNSDKALVEHAMSGFKAEFEASFLKQLKKAFKSGLENNDKDFYNKILQGMDMVGPAFKFSSNVNMELNFDDMDEVKNHPMSSSFLVSLDQLIQGAMGSTKDEILNWKPDYSEVEGEEAVKNFVKENPEGYTSHQYKKIERIQMIQNIINNLDPNTNIEFKTNALGYASHEIKIQGAGYSTLIALLFNGVTMDKNQQTVNNIIMDIQENK